VKAKRDKRILVISDLHCGHVVGLTPPRWRNGLGDTAREELQTRLWGFYISSLRRWKPFDIVLVNGDMTDGKGERSGGTELITTDRLKQAEMASECILTTGCRVVRAKPGTPYHVGMSEDFEAAVIDKLKTEGVDANIDDASLYEVNDRIINMKHFVSGSSIPHGRDTAILRDGTWNLQWMLEGETQADLFIRSHVHYSRYIFDGNRHFIITPALQGLGSKGARKWSGVVHFGITVIDISKTGAVKVHFETLRGLAKSKIQTL
jgi:hypothetical protein